MSDDPFSHDPVEIKLFASFDAESSEPLKAAKAQPLVSSGSRFRHLRALMTRPIFSLSPKRTKRIVIDTKSFYFEVSATHDQYALVADADVLAYSAAVLAAEMNRGEKLSTKLIFRPAQLLRAIHRSTDGARSYALLEQALVRLQSTNVLITEDRSNKGGGRRVQFPLIEGYERRTKGPWALWLPHWFTEEIEAKRILTLNPACFDLQSPLARCFYWWARAGVGTDREKRVSLSMKKAYDQSAATGEWSKFRAKTAEIAARNELPDYALSLDGDTLTMRMRREP